jgi:hypothetical protein
MQDFKQKTDLCLKLILKNAITKEETLEIRFGYE